jgi:hypothetical protein
MACVENGWQTSNGGAVQDDQDCLVDCSAGQTRSPYMLRFVEYTRNIVKRVSYWYQHVHDELELLTPPLSND